MEYLPSLMDAKMRLRLKQTEPLMRFKTKRGSYDTYQFFDRFEKALWIELQLEPHKYDTNYLLSVDKFNLVIVNSVEYLITKIKCVLDKFIKRDGSHLIWFLICYAYDISEELTERFRGHFSFFTRDTNREFEYPNYRFKRSGTAEDLSFNIWANAINRSIKYNAQEVGETYADKFKTYPITLCETM